MDIVMKVFSIILGAAIGFLGLYCLLSPDMGLDVLCVIIGCGMIIGGISNICLWSKFRKVGLADAFTLIGGIISIILGLAVIIGMVAKLVLATLVIYLIALWLVVMGIMWIFTAFKIRKAGKHSKGSSTMISWKTMLVLAIIMIILGVLVAFNPLFFGLLLGALAGVVMLIVGVVFVIIGIEA